MNENTTWLVPERRIRKFVKRQAQSNVTTPSDTSATAEDDKSVSSVRSRVKGITGRIFGSSKKKSAMDTVPVSEIQTTTPSLLSTLAIACAESTDEEVIPPPTPEPEVQVPTQGKDFTEASETEEVMDQMLADNLMEDDEPAETLFYKDDNDGKKGGPCSPCDGCVIM